RPPPGRRAAVPRRDGWVLRGPPGHRRPALTRGDAAHAATREPGDGLGSPSDATRGGPMAIIDVHRTWSKVEERLERETDPVLRRNLETVLEHMKAEAVGDIDGLLVTLSDDVAYHAYGTDEPALNPAGKGEVRTFYENFVASG